MRGKTIAGAVALAACGALAMTGSAGAGGAAETKVTIKAPGGDVYGYVKSTRPNRCANDRKVTVFRQKGGAQGGGDDIKVGTDNASPNGDRYQWNIGQPGVQGKLIYAKARRIEGCRGDSSRTIRAGTTD